MSTRKRTPLDMSGILGPEEPVEALPRPASRAARQIQTLDEARGVIERVRARIREDVMGRNDVIELVLVALFGGGHVLLEDYPGSGKTTLAKALGECLLDDKPEDDLASFRRIQFTPDLLPSDITGVMIFDAPTQKFFFRKGPVFAYLVLVDEINRTSPKVQAALLEAMAERQVTVDNTTYPLDELFYVIATQNPLDSVGTYPLPVAQLDRFLFKIPMTHIDRDSELEVLSTWGQPRGPVHSPKVFRGDIIEVRRIIRDEIAISPAIRECLVDIARNIRNDPRTAQGISTRSLVQAIPALQTLAIMRGRDFIAPEDVEHLCLPLFRHRVVTAPGVDEATDIVAKARKAPLEALARSTLSM